MRKRFYVMATALCFCALMVFSAVNSKEVFAKVTAIVVTTADGSNYEYNYEELKQSAVSDALGNTEGAVLYQHFMKNNAGIKDFYDDSRNVYVPGAVAANEAVSKMLKGLPFDINSYVEDSSTPTESVTTVKFTTSSGKVVVVEVDSDTFGLENIN